MIYQDLVYSLEKACVLVTVTYLASRTRMFAVLGSGITRRTDKLSAILFFGCMGLAEVLLPLAYKRVDAPVVSATAAGLLAGLPTGICVGAAAATLAALLQRQPLWFLALPVLLSAMLGGWISLYRSSFRSRVTAGFLAGTLGHGTYLAVSFLRDPMLASWGAIAIGYFMPMTLSGAGVALFLVIVNDMRVQRERIESQAQAISRAELKALQAQVHPHFLFNALNTIAGFCELNPRQAAELTVKLGDFFRRSFRTDREPVTTVREELEAVDSYLDIERARFGDRLKITEQVDPSSSELRLPAFALQPLVENAIIHGVARKTGEAAVRIVIRHRGGRLVCWVTDNGRGFEARTSGWRRNNSHALSILANRLERMYGIESGLRVRSSPGKGTLVCLWVPVMGNQQTA